MKKVRIAELRGGLSRYLGYVRKGGTLVVLDRDVPVAKIVPFTTGERKIAARRIAKSPARRASNAASKAAAVSQDESRAHRKAEDEARLDRLERAGLIRRGKGDFGEWLRTHELPAKLPSGIKLKGGILQALLEERESGW